MLVTISDTFSLAGQTFHVWRKDLVSCLYTSCSEECNSNQSATRNYNLNAETHFHQSDDKSLQPFTKCHTYLFYRHCVTVEQASGIGITPDPRMNGLAHQTMPNYVLLQPSPYYGYISPSVEMGAGSKQNWRPSVKKDRKTYFYFCDKTSRHSARETISSLSI